MASPRTHETNVGDKENGAEVYVVRTTQVLDGISASTPGSRDMDS